MKNQPGTNKTRENQPGTTKTMKTHLEPWKTMKNNLEPWKTMKNSLEPWKSTWWKCSFFVSYAGSQLTFMTQNEKVLIFRYSRGVKTDLRDTEWESAHFSLLTRGHNWPFRCLDKVGQATFGQDNVAKFVMVMSVNIMLVRIKLVLKYWSGWNWQSWSWPRCRRKEGKSGVALLPFCCFCFSFCRLL